MGQRGDLYGALHPLPTVYLLKKTNNEKCCSKPNKLTDQSSLGKHMPSVENSTMLEAGTVICVTIQLIAFYLENYAAHRQPNNNSNNKL